MARVLIDPRYLLRLIPHWIHVLRSDSNPIGQCCTFLGDASCVMIFYGGFLSEVSRVGTPDSRGATGKPVRLQTFNLARDGATVSCEAALRDESGKKAEAFETTITSTYRDSNRTDAVIKDLPTTGGRKKQT